MTRRFRLFVAVPDAVAPAVAGFSVPGMVLLLLGWFVVPAVIALGVLGAAAAVVVVLRHGGTVPEDSPEARRRAVVWTLAALVLAGGFFVGNAYYSAEDLRLWRDPGTYSVAGQWLVHNESALVPAGDEVFGDVPGMTAESPGVGQDTEDPGRLYFQGNHLLPVLLAVGGWVGGPDMLLNTNAAIGALGLLAVFALARRFAGGGAAFVVTAALGLSIPMLAFSRDTYSEPLTLLLLIGGLVVLWRAIETRRVGQFLVAGITLGMSASARVDAYAALMAVVVAGSVLLAAARAGGRREWAARVGALLGGMTVTAALGYIDVAELSSGYYRDLGNRVPALLQAGAGAAVAGLVGVLVWWRWAGPLRRLVRTSHRQRWAVAAAVAVVLLFVVLLSRPLWMTSRRCTSVAPLIEALQVAFGEPADACRVYNEMTVHWLAWYYGWPTVVLMAAGLALLVHRVIRHGDLRLVAMVGMVLALSGLYFVNARITPDQVWAMRRFLPVVIPGLLAAAAYALAVLWRHRGRWGRWGRAGGGAAIALAMATVALPVVITHPTWSLRPGVHQLGQIQRVCDAVGEDAAILSVGRWTIGSYVQTARSFCGVPVQSMAKPTTDQLAQIRDNVEDSGRRLFVMAERPDAVPYESGVEPAPFDLTPSMRWPQRLVDVPQVPHHYTAPVYLGTVNQDGTVHQIADQR